MFLRYRDASKLQLTRLSFKTSGCENRCTASSISRHHRFIKTSDSFLRNERRIERQRKVGRRRRGREEGESKVERSFGEGEGLQMEMKLIASHVTRCLTHAFRGKRVVLMFMSCFNFLQIFSFDYFGFSFAFFLSFSFILIVRMCMNVRGCKADGSEIGFFSQLTSVWLDSTSRSDKSACPLRRSSKRLFTW